MVINFTVISRKKSPLEEAAERSGSKTRSGMQPTISKSDVTRIVAGIEKAETGARACSAPILLSALENLLKLPILLKLKKTGPGLSTQYSELCRIQKEVEEMRCSQIVTNDDFKRCERKFVEWKKQLDALEGIP